MTVRHCTHLTINCRTIMSVNRSADCAGLHPLRVLLRRARASPDPNDTPRPENSHEPP